MLRPGTKWKEEGGETGAASLMDRAERESLERIGLAFTEVAKVSVTGQFFCSETERARCCEQTTLFKAILKNVFFFSCLLINP